MNWTRSLQFLAIAVIIFVADVLVKAYVHYQIPVMSHASSVYPFDGVGVFQDWYGIDFSITHVINRGAAWGVFSSMQEYLLYGRMMIIGGLLTYLLFIKADAYRKFCLTLIVTGAIGNVVDYFVYGHVVDMFYFIFWGFSFAVFNIADTAIFCGISLLLLQSAVEKCKKPSKSKVRTSTP